MMNANVVSNAVCLFPSLYWCGDFSRATRYACQYFLPLVSSSRAFLFPFTSCPFHSILSCPLHSSTSLYSCVEAYLIPFSFAAAHIVHLLFRKCTQPKTDNLFSLYLMSIFFPAFFYTYPSFPTTIVTLLFFFSVFLLFSISQGISFRRPFR